MNFDEKTTVHIAILDLNAGAENQGMRCLREIINQFGEYNHLNIIAKEFDVRQKLELPGTEYDIYISSGGPGSPVESIGMEWDNQYMTWLKKMEIYNEAASNVQKKVYLFYLPFISTGLPLL